MRYILLLTFFVSSTLFANYAYTGENGGKIDMHGGKKQNLVGEKKDMSKKPFLLGNIGLQNSVDKKEKTKEKTNNKD